MQSRWLCVGLLLFATSCASVKVTEPPAFDYPNLLETFFRKNPRGHFPVVIQRGLNTDPSVSADGYLFYVSDSLGSSDIWMRQLRTTVNVPVVEQEAVQNSPAISQDGRLLAYVSYDRDASGDVLITKITPDRIARDVLLGNAIPNHRASSQSISQYIGEVFRENRDSCSGDAAELDPVFSQDRKTLYYASDRCERGVFRIWKIALSESGRPESKPELLSPLRAIQPATTVNNLVATALDATGHPDGFVMISLQSGQTERIHVPVSGLALKPILAADEKEILFMSVKSDTNGDGRLDLNDRGSVQRYILKAGILRHVTDNTMPVYSIALSSYLGGGILYAGYDAQGGHSRIYLSRTAGLVLKKENALEQYKLASTFIGERRQLALESVFQYFSDAPEFFLIEYDVLSSLFREAKETGDRKRYGDQLQRAVSENPFNEAARIAGAGTATALERALRSPAIQALGESQQKLARSYLRERLAAVREQSGQQQQALAVIHQLNEDDPDYFNRNKTLLIEARLQIRLNGTIPDRFRSLLSSPETGSALRQRVIQVVYEEMEERTIPDPVGETEPVLRGLYLIMQGERLFQQRRYDDARSHIQEGLKSTGGGNLAFTIGWKLLAAIYDIEQHHQLALDARLRFLQSYQRDWNLDVDEADFLRLVETSRSYVESFRRSAESIAEDVEDRLDYRFFLISELKTAVAAERIQLNMVDRNLLAEFCAPGSAAGLLINNLGYRDYIERYARICGAVAPYIRGTTSSISLEEGHEVSQLFYLVSYANATLVNIMFLQFRAAGLFDELHETWSVHYHRWKTDLAIERLKRELVWEEKTSRIISRDTVQSLFLEKDPFTARIFNEILEGYKFAEQDGRRYFDHSLLYGHAYLLIRKSEERERFYDSLLSQGVKIPPAVMADRKKAILDDLKQAEYRLLYILNVDPGFIDATLLLSWLYQYIDSRKDSRVLLDPGYIDQTFSWLTGIRPSSVRDGIFYRSEYQNTFNGRYYERNVDMLLAAIEEIEQQDTTGKERNLALLNLNLGNNHFQLVNYKAAAEAYDQAEKLSRKSQIGIFHDDMQQILFYINRGRARYYAGLASGASGDFDFAVERLRATDYWPLFEAANRAQYLALAEPKNAYLKARNERRQAELVQGRYRLAFAQSLRGLAHQDGGNARQAIQAYADALQILYGREPHPPQGMDRAGLENYMAIAFQELEEFEKSDLAAREAAESASDAGLSRNDSRFQPQTVGGRIFGFFLGYGEDFSVIGDGRTPFGFSPLRQYELSLGIRFRNYMRQGDLDQAVSVLARRLEVFRKNDGDVQLGREGQVYAFNQRAEIALNQGDYEKAFEDYRSAADEAYSAGMLDSFRRNFRNSYMVIFQEFEALEGAADMEGRMRSGLKDLVSFRENYRDALEAAYIRQRETEDPDFSYVKEQDDPVIERMMVRDLADFSAIEGMLAHYLRMQRQRSGRSDGDKDLLEQARERLTASSSADASAPTLAGIRTRLNLARILMEEQSHSDLVPLLERLQEETFEFHAIPERFEYFRIRSDYATASQRPQESLRYLREADQLLREYPYILPLIGERLHSLYERMAELELMLNNPASSLLILERLRMFQLQLEFYRYPLEFSERDSTEIHKILRQGRARLRLLLAEETRLRLERRNPADVIRLRQEEMNNLQAMQKELLAIRPQFKDFISYSPVALPSRLDQKQYLRLLSTRRGQHCIRFYRGLIESAGTIEGCKIQAIPSVILADARSATDGFLGMALRQIGPQRVMRTTLQDTSPILIQNEGDVTEGFRFFNVRSGGPAAEENVLKLDDVPFSHFFARRSGTVFSSGNWISRDRYAALALIPSPESDDLLPDDDDDVRSFRRWWAGMAFSYEVFRSGGGGIFLVHGEDIPDDPARFGRGQSLSFGTQGFDRSTLRDYLIAKHHQSMVRGLALIQKDRQAALRQFEEADSFLQGLPDEASIGAKNRLHLARSLILVRPDEGELFFQALLKQETERLNRYAVFRSYIGGLATVGRFQKALDVYRESLREFPEQFEKKQVEHAVLEYLNGMNRTTPEGIFLNSSAELLALFQNQKSLMTAGSQLLYRHGSFDLAAELNSRSDETDQALALRLAIESALLKGEGIERAVRLLEQSSLTEEDTDLKLILSAYRSRWKYVDDLLKGMAPGMSRTLFEQRRLLFRQLYQRREEHSAGLESLTCLVGLRPSANLLDILPFRNRGGERESACAQLTQTEQLLQLRMALDSIPFDGTDQVRTVVQQLIEGTRRYSTKRASLYALMAARAYLLERRPAVASEFLDIHATLSGKYPVPQSLAQTEAATALWLQAIGFRTGTNLLERSVQLEYGSALFHGIAPIVANNDIQPSTVTALSKALRSPLFSIMDARLGIYTLQEKAIKLDRPAMLLNLLIAEKRLQQGRDWSSVDFTESFQKRLPEGQHLTVLHDSGTNFLTLHVTRDNIKLSMSISSLPLKSGLLDYYQRGSGHGSAVSLSGEYDVLLERFDEKIHYRWLTGIHGLAPLLLSGNEVQIIDPEWLMNGDRHTGQMKRQYTVAVQTDSEPRSLNELYRRTLRQLLDWTNLEMRRLKGPATYTLLIQEGWRATQSARTWMIFEEVSRPVPDLTPGVGLPPLFNFGTPPGLAWSGSGVMARMPQGALEFIPGFARAFTKADLPAETLRQRFDYARQQVQDSSGAEYLLFKPATASFLP